MLKITRLFNKLASSRNNDNRSTFERNDSNNEINRFGISGNSVEYTKKLEKLFKSRKLKRKKMSKF